MAEAMAAEEIFQVQFLIDFLLVRSGPRGFANRVYVSVAPWLDHCDHLVATQFLVDRSLDRLYPAATFLLSQIFLIHRELTSISRDGLGSNDDFQKFLVHQLLGRPPRRYGIPIRPPLA